MKRRDGSDDEQGLKKMKEGPERKEESFGIKQNEGKQSLTVRLNQT